MCKAACPYQQTWKKIVHIPVLIHHANNTRADSPMSLKCFGGCLVRREKNWCLQIFLQTNKQTKTVSFVSGLNAQHSTTMSHPQLWTAMRAVPAGICAWHNWAAPVLSQKDFPEQLPAARMGSEKWLCHRICAPSLNLHHSPGKKHLSAFCCQNLI